MSTTTPAPDESTVALVAALRTLPEAQRRAIVLHHLAGLPVAEVARVERCPEGTVKARLSRGRPSLSVELGDATPSPDSPPPESTEPTDDQEPSHA